MSSTVQTAGRDGAAAGAPAAAPDAASVAAPVAATTAVSTAESTAAWTAISTAAQRPLRVLVLGASGFIGERIVAALAASGWATPVAASRRGTSRCPGVATLRLDARDALAVSAALRDADAAVNCVAGDADAIVAGARALFGAGTRTAPAPRIVHLSTMQVYGTARGSVDETAPLLGDWDGYSAAKAQAEGLARDCASVVILRPGIVYGPDSPVWSRDIARWLRAGRLGDLGSAGDGICNLVHVDDVVEAVLRSLRMTGIDGEAFNLCMRSPPTWNGYFREFAGALATAVVPISGRQLHLECAILGPAFKAAQIFAQAGGLAWRPPAPLRPWFLRLCTQALRLDAGKAERVLGLRWRPLDQGLRECAAALGTGP